MSFTGFHILFDGVRTFPKEASVSDVENFGRRDCIRVFIDEEECKAESGRRPKFCIEVDEFQNGLLVRKFRKVLPDTPGARFWRDLDAERWDEMSLAKSRARITVADLSEV